jgi:hypothetical protein
MNEPNLSDREADAINEQMVAAMEQRRQGLPNRRQSSDDRPRSPVVERRRICGYCYQRGDHPTPTHCMRALERPSRD